MKDLLTRILSSAASAMWRNEPTLGRYTRETAEHELNLAFHYAAELRGWFPWLDCDFDVTKLNFNRERPDIILHRRNTGLNFLVIEVKRAGRAAGVKADLKKIRDHWFAGGLRYRFGASVVLDEPNHSFAIRLLSRDDSERELTLSKAALSKPVSRPEFCPDCAVLISLADQIVAAQRAGHRAAITRLEQKMDAQFREQYDAQPRIERVLKRHPKCRLL